MKRFEVDIGLSYDVALMIMFIHENGLWERFQSYKDENLPLAKQEVENLFREKGWLNEN